MESIKPLWMSYLKYRYLLVHVVVLVIVLALVLVFLLVLILVLVLELVLALALVLVVVPQTAFADRGFGGVDEAQGKVSENRVGAPVRAWCSFSL
jgi:uncharacterized membrane protein